MKTLKSFKEESYKFYSEHPEYFKKSYGKRMGGTQTLIIEGIGTYQFDDRAYYKGRGAKYNNASMHELLGDVVVTTEEFMKKVNERAKIQYQMEKNKAEYIRQYRKSYREAAALVGKEKLDEGIELVKSIKDKTYYFIDNVRLYKAYLSETVTIEIVSDEVKQTFNWEKWYSAPYAKELGMTPANKNLFIC